MTQGNIVLFGGSFNPPHLGHRQVIEFIINLYDKVWIIPTFKHAFDKALIDFEHRLQMCQIMISGLEQKVEVLTTEKDLKLPTSYTIDTVRALKKAHPGITLTVAIGSDCKNDLPKWKESEALAQEVNFYFIPRAGFENSPFVNISSSEIRELIKNKKPYEQYLIPEVAEYIKRHQLYS